MSYTVIETVCYAQRVSRTDALLEALLLGDMAPDQKKSEMSRELWPLTYLRRSPCQQNSYPGMYNKVIIHPDKAGQEAGETMTQQLYYNLLSGWQELLAEV